MARNPFHLGDTVRRKDGHQPGMVKDVTDDNCAVAWYDDKTGMWRRAISVDHNLLTLFTNSGSYHG